MISCFFLTQARAVGEQLYFRQVGVHGDLRHIFHTVHITFAAKMNKGLIVHGFVGKNGVSRDAHEGANMTPFGLYSLGEAFYMKEKPETGLPSFEITPDTYWVDDPASAFYNLRREGTLEQDWNSAEHMIDFPYQYEYGFVIKYNMDPIVPGKGSAIFFHINDKCTAGCVAVSREECLAYLKALQQEKHPHILMVTF